MNFLDKLKIKTGISQRNQFDLSSDHVTTSDFFRVNPVHFLHTVPGGKYNIKAQTFTRLSAMTNPVLGRCTIHNRAFFVPNEIIMHCWNAFITDSPYSDATTQNVIPSKVTTVKASEIVKLFQRSAYSAASGSSSNYDFLDYSVGTSPDYRLFSPLGRRCFSILLGLGYKVALGAASVSLRSGASGNDLRWDVEYNALPLLAFFKVYKDWYANQAYNQYQYDEVFYRVNGSLNDQDLDMMFSLINLAMYDKDYFTAAWDSPVNPNAGVDSTYVINDITNNRTTATNRASQVRSLVVPSSTNPSTPNIGTNDPNNNSPVNVTQFVIDQLKALTDYMKRNQIVGAKYADRMLARFGVKPSDAELHLSVPFGSDETLVQISDVMSTATGSATIGSTTHKSLLGDYAGKGIGFGKGGFYYETSDYGIIIIVSTIIPKVGYVQGSNRFNTMYKNRLDFFTPEFDGKSGVQAIREDELKSDWMGYATTGHYPDNVFGFIPRWADMKIGFDNLSGDFCINSRKAGLDAWHLFRMFPDLLTLADTQHNEAFTRGDSAAYDRIFAYTNEDYDHFVLIYNFNVSASLPMSRLFDSYEFDGGKEITMEVDGKQFN